MITGTVSSYWKELPLPPVSFFLDAVAYKEVATFFRLPAAQEGTKRVESLLLNPFNNYFEIRLGLECDNKCTHCFIANRSREKTKTFEDIKSIIDTIPSGWIIGVTGGEPTIRKDFLDILSYIRSKGSLAYVQTHGRQFAKLSFTQSACNHLDGLLVAVHSHIPAIHDEITQSPGSGKETWQGLQNLAIDGRAFIISQTVIVRKNYTHLLEIANAVQQVNPTGRMSFTFPHPVAGAYSKEVTPSLTELKPYLHTLLARWGSQIQTHYIPRCYLFPYQDTVFNVDRYGTGEYARPGIDVLDGEWAKTDYGTPAGKVKAEQCKTCRYADSCTGVWKEYAELYGLSELTPI